MKVEPGAAAGPSRTAAEPASAASASANSAGDAAPHGLE